MRQPNEIKYGNGTLRDAIVSHGKWLRCGGGEKLRLGGADLDRVNLHGADLRGADFGWAKLRGTDLSEASLIGAVFTGANLSRAKLRGANLCHADLSAADLTEANLTGADISGANVRGADLRGASMSGAKSSYLTLGYHLACPETGAFDGFKKCRDGVIVKLRIPASAKRSSATTRKCRAEFAKVLSVYGSDEGVSIRDRTVKYRKGETVRCHDWDDDRWNECAGGIHFFLTRAEAEEWLS